MNEPPPRWFRRLIWDPLFLVAAVLLLVSLPLWLLVAAFASRFVPGRWRILRVAWFLFVYLFFQSVMLVVLLGLWVASGFGWKMGTPRFVDLHYRLAGWWLRRVMGSARRTFSLTFSEEETGRPLEDGPLLVFSRHAGPGDSFLLVDAVLNRLDRRPRIVLKDMLQLDPCIDVFLNRLPNAFVPTQGRAGDAVVEALADLASGMGPHDALILFPEGGNFTPRRHARSIEKLEEIGRPKLAERARNMENVLPPKPGGALTAIDAAPDADVLFVGHTGLEHLSTLRDLWRGIPMDSDIHSVAWTVRADELPPAAEREHWLYDHWARIDDWIEQTLAAG